MDLEAVIGLEIHVQLKTASKMFCTCSNIVTGDEAFDGAQAKPNTAICPICLGYPGTLPVPNRTAIAWTQRAGAALGCELAMASKFDRKSYFYPDLPKAYQISQFDQPFCGEGKLDVIVEDQPRTIGIERIHLEEDAAKNSHSKTYTLIDYNRAGTPLMEIVTKPDLRTPEEARVFLQELQRIMRTLDVSDADMEKGQMRCDANISLREKGSTELHPKTEIKNVNSFKFVAKALEHEITRQAKLWAEAGPPQEQATRGFDSNKGVTTEQRTKEEAADYRYFPEPDIPLFEFTEEDLQDVKAGLPELPSAKRARFMKRFRVSADQAELLVADDDLASFFENTVSELQQLDNEEVAISPSEVPKLVKLAANITLQQVRALPSYEQVTPANFAELVVLVQQGKVSKNVVGQVLAEMAQTGGDPDHLIQHLGLEQVSDASDLERYVDEVIADNPDIVAKIKAGKEAARQALMGQIMAKTKGAAHPGEVIALLKQRLAK